MRGKKTKKPEEQKRLNLLGPYKKLICPKCGNDLFMNGKRVKCQFCKLGKNAHKSRAMKRKEGPKKVATELVKEIKETVAGNSVV